MQLNEGATYHPFFPMLDHILRMSMQQEQHLAAMSGKVSALEREINKSTEVQKELQDLIKETSIKQYKLRDDGFDVSLSPIDGLFNLTCI